ncbi:TRAP transporter large permease [Bengtsoniella intestinalis]|uniref:TRAP transporter large permease n=1 Tax=Bengtsoniella intestinalis TaxID=3073143 RepID=UPI00391F7734
MDIATTAAVVMIVGVVVTLILGFPIGLSIGASSTAAMMVILGFGSAALTTAAQRTFTGANSFSLLAIPFFVLAGNIMNNGGIAKRLIGCANIFAHRLPGHLAQTNIVANMLFGAVSGSGVAAASAMGGILRPLEEEEGYTPEYSAAVNIASGPTGMMIPPSNIMIVYATVAGSVSVTALFMAGYIPGILWGLGCMIVAGFTAKKNGYISKEHYTMKRALRTLWDGLPSLLLIVIVIGGILGGVFTATEGSAIAVCYSLLLSAIYRSIKITDMPRILLDSVKTTAIVEFLVCVSSIMSWVLSFAKIPQMISDGMLQLSENPIVILLIMNVILLFVGTFMDPTPAVLIFTPIFLPIVQSFGMSAVHFGLMMVMNLCVGTITPPVGAILFAGCRIGDVKIEQIVKPLLPYFFVVVVCLLLVTYVPLFSMGIPYLLDLVTVGEGFNFFFIM